MADTERSGGRGLPPPRTFPPDVVQEARSMRVTPELLRDREEVLGISIKNSFSREISKAFWLEKMNGGYKLQVSMVDVASLVEKDSRVDASAYEAGFTQYRGRQSDPMFPRELSEDQLSLKEDQMRPTITVTIPLDEDLDVAGEPELALTKLANKKNLNYPDVDDILTDHQDPMRPLLLEYATVATKLQANRRERGALAFFDIDRRIATNEDGMVIPLNDEEAHIGKVIDREFTFLAQEVLALYLTENQFPLLYRNQKPRQHAPTAASLATDIQATIDNPNLHDPETLRKRMQLVLERSSYSPLLEGHFSNNAVAYGDFLEPISNYSAVVNQRMLRAFIAGDELPHTFDELEAIGDHLNGVRRAQGEAKKQFAKAVAAMRRPEPSVQKPEVSLASLDRRKFSDVIKTASESGQLPEALSEEIVRRLGAGELTVHDMYLLLVTPEEVAETWRSVHTVVINALQANLPFALSIAHDGVQGKKWLFNEGRSVKIINGRKVFTMTPTIKFLDTNKTYSGTAQGWDEKTALAQALIQVFAKRYGVEFAPFEPGTTTISTSGEVFVRSPRPTRDFKTSLEAIRGTNNWLFPSYELENVSGPDNNRVFAIVAKIMVGNKEVEGRGSGTRVKDAEQFAAENLIIVLHQLRGLGEIQFANPAPEAKKVARRGVAPEAEVPKVVQIKPIEIIDGNYITGINTLQARAKWPKPGSQISHEGNEMICQMVVRPPGHKEVIVTVRMRKTEDSTADRQAIRQKAAKQLFEILSNPENGYITYAS